MRPWPKRALISALSQFWSGRHRYLPVVRLPVRAVRWSVGAATGEKVERLKDLVSSAGRLAETLASPGWKDVLDAKAYAQSLADHYCKNPSLPEAKRFQAACEWAAIEGFFIEVHNRVRRGREADATLAKQVTKTANV